MGTRAQLGIAAAAVIFAACPRAKGPNEPSEHATESCARASGLLERAAAEQTDGYLGRALALFERAQGLCPGPDTDAALAAARDALWIDDASLATHGHDVDFDTRARARLLYQAGQILRERDGDYATALERFEQSYALWPHPLTIVQMGLTHRAAGREGEYRKANARALEVAIRIQNAQPRAELHAGHTGSVSDVAYHPQRRALATASDDGTAIIWDLSSGRPTRRLAGHDGKLTALAFSPDGALLATVGDDKIARVWDPAAGDVVRAMNGHAGAIRDVAFSPDGTLLATAGYVVKLWSIESGEQIRQIDFNAATLAFSPDGAHLALGSGGYEDSEIAIYAVADAARVRRFSTDPARGGVSQIAYSPDGSTLASAGGDHSIRLWNPATGEGLAAFTEHKRIVVCVAFDADGGQLLSADVEGKIEVRDVESGTVSVELDAGFGLRAAAFAPGRDQLASAGGLSPIRIWDTQTGAVLETLPRNAQTRSIVSLEVSPDGSHIASVPQSLELWRLASDGGIVELSHNDERAEDVAFSPDGAQVATGGRDGSVRVRDVATGAQRHALLGHIDTVNDVAFSPDGTTLASAGTDKSIRLWDVASGAERAALIGHDSHPSGVGGVATVAFSPDGATLASGAWDSTIKLWSTSDGAELRTIAGHSDVVFDVAFSPDGATLASASADHTIRLWDVSTGDALAVLTGHADVVISIAFSPNGAHLASASWDGSVRLWSVASQSAVVLDDSGGAAQAVAFTPDGSHLLAAGNATTIRVWGVPEGALVATALSRFPTGWVVTSPDGRVDGPAGNDSGASLIYWQVGSIQLPGFVGWQRYHTPGLLGAIVGRL